MDQRLIDKCEALGWSVRCDDDGGADVAQYTPAGEDFSFYVETEDFVDNVKQYSADFDPDEHIAMWIEAKGFGTSGVPSARELVHDAEAIDEMLQNLAIALCEVQCEIEKEEAKDVVLDEWLDRYIGILGDDWFDYHDITIYKLNDGRRSLAIDGDEVYCGNQDEIIAVLKSLIKMTGRKLIKHVR